MNTNTPLLQRDDEAVNGRDPHEDDIEMPPLGGTGTPVSVTPLTGTITLLSV